MKIEDYKNVTDRIEIREECRKEIINMSIEKNKSKHKWSKKTFIPVIAAAIVGCTAITAAFADDVISVFSKQSRKLPPKSLTEQSIRLTKATNLIMIYWKIMQNH